MQDHEEQNLSDTEQNEVDMEAAAHEVERQKIADLAGVPLDQVQLLTIEEQEAGAINVPLQSETNSAHSYTEGSDDHLRDKALLQDEIKAADLHDVKSEEEEFQQFLSSEENRQHALQLAEQIQDVCGDKWFSLDKFVKKTMESRQTAFQKLKLCEMFGLLGTRLGDHNDDRKLIREPLYRIVISAKDKVEALDRIIAYHTDQINKLTIDRNLLAESIPASSSE